ncbi:MAG: HAD family hydrolase [Candidatus Abyssubacteria bacterium]
MAEYAVVIFDLDGTLTDPKAGITKSIRYALSKFGIEVDNLDSLVPWIGAPLRESFKKNYSFDDTQASQAVEYYREYFSEKGIYQNEVYPGIPELLEGLRDDGRKLVVATYKAAVFADRVLDHFGLRHHFVSVVGNTLDFDLPSKTDIVRMALSVVPGLLKETAVMVGDREHDIIGARENAIDSIGVTYGYGTIDELKRANPTHIAASVEELRKLLTQ